MSFEITQTFLDDQRNVSPKNASAAIIVNKYDQVLLQLRDDKEGIFFPNHWGFFGGASEDGEEFSKGLIRELEEELTIVFDYDQIKQYIRVDLGFDVAQPLVKRVFYIVSITDHQTEQLQLKEGKACRFFSREESLTIPNFTPYDRYALWVYFNQKRIQLG